MKKYIKYLSSFLLMFTAIISSVSAVTIKETLIEGDGYSTIEDGSIVIGVTKFHSDVVVTGGRATKAGSDAAVIHLKLNGNLDDFETPVIYVYAGGAWFALDKNNDASVVEDAAILDDLSNKDIYYVNDDEKLLDIDVSGINVDTSKLPKGVTYKDGKIWVKATKDSVTIFDKNGAEYKFVKDRGLWGLDQSECYEVTGREITGYSNTCSKDVIIPSKVGDTEIVSVGADAFRNKGIKTVVIPNHIISLGDKSFADNELTHVTIENKYDESDFDYYGDNVFGSFKDEDIIWKNDLTALLDKFDDEVEVKVSNTFKEHKFEYDDDKYYVYPSFIKQQQINKLGLSVDKYGRVNGKYNIIYSVSDEENKLDLYINDENHYVEKKISFNIVNVNEKNDDYKNIKKEYEEYFETIKAKMKKKDFSSKLTGIDGLIDIADKYNYEVITMANGFGDGPIDYSGEPNKANKFLIYNGTLHYVYEDMPFYSSIFFPVAIDSELKESEEIFAAMKEEFEKETNITEYNVFYTDSYGNVDKYEYVINLDVEEMDEVFVLYYSIVPEKGKLYLNYESDYSNQYTYYPKKSLNDFNGYVQQYFENAYDELIDTYNVEIDNISISSWVDYSSEVNEDGLYDAIYRAEGTIYNNEDNKYYYYNVSVNNPKPTKTKDIFVESFVEFDNNKDEEEYEQDVLGVFLEKTKLDNIYISSDYINKFKYDESKDKYVEVYGPEAEGKGILDGYYIFDFNTNARYIALFKNFYDREPGTLFKTSTDIIDGDFVYNYKYIPVAKYNGGKVSDYVEILKQELKEKININDDNSYFSFGYSGATCNGSNECSTTYSLTYYVDGVDANHHYSVYFDVITNGDYDYEYIHTSTVNPEDYEYDLYDNMVYSECINGLGLTDYYITNVVYYYEDEYNKYELYDFANNRRIMIIAKRFALG